MEPLYAVRLVVEGTIPLYASRAQFNDQPQLFLTTSLASSLFSQEHAREIADWIDDAFDFARPAQVCQVQKQTITKVIYDITPLHA